MPRSDRKSLEVARNQLAALVAKAEDGHITVITRHGRSVAAIVPVAHAGGAQRQKSLAGLTGSGKGLWGKDSTKALRRLRDAWKR